MSPHGTRSRYNNAGCRCDRCRDANTQDAARRKAERYAYVDNYSLPPTVEHGRSAYNNWGCRCPICCAAQAEANRSSYRSAVARYPERKAYVAEHGLPPTVEHGASAYSYWGCRCEVCRNAGTEKRRKYSTKPT